MNKIMMSMLFLIFYVSIPAILKPTSKGDITPFQEIKVAVNPVVCLHYHIRSMLHGDDDPEKAYISALESARDFEREVKTPLRWGFIEPFLIKCHASSDLDLWIDKIPERFRLRSGMIETPRKSLIPYIQALAEAEPAYMNSIWPIHKGALLEAKKKLDQVFNVRGAELLEYITDKLDIKSDQRPLRIYLTPATSMPYGSTCSARGVGVVSFVNITNISDAKLIEVVLHEAIHALDLRSQGKPTVLNLIRKKLMETGCRPNNPLFRDLPHAVIFVQAAETVQRLLHDPSQEYEYDSAFFKKSPRIIKDVPSKWKAYLDGSMSREEIIDAVTAIE